MDTQRLILFFVFSFSLLLLWDAWQKEQRPAAPAIAQSAKQGGAQATVPRPSVPTQAAPGLQRQPGDAIPPTKAAPGKHQNIRVKTDYFIADIDLQGGDIVRLE